MLLSNSWEAREKCFNISKGYSEVVNRGRTAHIMTKRKRTNNGLHNITEDNNRYVYMVY
jgi:hypothetical protein